MAYFADFFKALFAKLGQKNSNNYGTASNTGVPLLDMSDMSAKGGMDLNTLMSVLGVFKSVTMNQDEDCNNLRSCIAYARRTENIQNMPTEGYYCIASFYSNGFQFQLASDIVNVELYYRRYNPSAAESLRWSAWKKIAFVS